MERMKTLIFLFTFLLLGISNYAQYKIGDKVENFSLKNIDSKIVSLSDYSSDKGAIIIFTCNHCPFAIAWEDRIIALHKKYASQGFPVIAINPNDDTDYPDDSFEGMIKRANEKEFPFAYLHDEKQSVFPKFGAERTPHIFIIENTNGEFYLRYIGAIDDNYKNASEVKEAYVENAVNELLTGEQVSLNFTKSVGCSIKVKK